MSPERDSKLWTKERIEKRLLLPQPLRVSELAAMTGYDQGTIRKMVAIVCRTVRLASRNGKQAKERRIPVLEAQRVLIDLSIL